MKNGAKTLADVFPGVKVSIPVPKMKGQKVGHKTIVLLNKDGTVPKK
jgi:hypothetical protein